MRIPSRMISALLLCLALVDSARADNSRSRFPDSSAQLVAGGGNGVPTTRLVGTSAPLTGGSTLAGDLSLSCPTCVTTSRAVNTSSPLTGGSTLAGDLLLSCPTCVTTSRAVNTSSPLTGGSTLAGDLSLSCPTCATLSPGAAQAGFLSVTGDVSGRHFVPGGTSPTAVTQARLAPARPWSSAGPTNLATST